MLSLENSQPVGGTYKLLKLIGAGSMGEVYQARHLISNQLVAIKHLKPETINDTPDTIARFKREGEALRQLNHPNVVKMLEAIEENNQHYLVMEFVSGGSLSELLKRQPRLPVDQTLKIGMDIADALTRTHHLKIVHRDLKPSNVLLTEDNTARLSDFGIAHVGTAERITENGTLMGTLDYLSPESINGDGVGTSSDTWAFGIILFEMLAGKRPFSGPTLSQLISGILTKPVPDLEALRPDAPTALVDLIYRMLAKDPQQRIASMRGVGAELESISKSPNTSFTSRATRTPDGSSLNAKTGLSTQTQHNLPAQTTKFVGRDEELVQLGELLNKPEVRLVTIMASGGMGKTRLAIETAHTQLERFPSGVFFVPLAPINSPDAIISAITEAARYSFSGSADPKQQLLQMLNNKQLLLILDNFEHLLSGAGLVAEILQAAPSVKILVTSRSKLNLQGESTFLIQGMEMPSQTKSDSFNLGRDAVKLFMQSARQIQPDFALQQGDLAHLLNICHQVEGLPLGIVLAAAWVDTLTLSEISTEIAKSLDFLETEHQNIPTRQRSVQAVFDYSWNLLSDDEKKIFTWLSVFQGDFTRDAAEKVAGATLKILAALVHKSMVRRNTVNGRYSIHELLRQYAAQKLESSSEAEDARKAHSDYFADYADERLVDLHGRRQIDALRDMDAEFNNLQAAWHHLLTRRAMNRLTNFAMAFWAYFDLRSRHQDGIRLFEDAIPVLRNLPQRENNGFLTGLVLAIESYHYAGIGAAEQSEAGAKEAISILERYQNLEALALAWCGLSLGYGVSGSPEFSQAAQQFGNLALETGSAWLMTRGYLWLGLANWGTPDVAKDHFLKCLKIAEQINDVYFIAAAYLRLGHLANYLQDYSGAKQYAGRALPHFVKVGQPWSINQTEMLLGDAAFQLKDYAGAKIQYRKALSVYKEYATTNELLSFVLKNVEILGQLGQQSQIPEAVTLLSLVSHQAESAGNAPYIVDEVVKLRTSLANALPPMVFDAAWTRGSTLDLMSVINTLLNQEGANAIPSLSPL